MPRSSSNWPRSTYLLGIPQRAVLQIRNCADYQQPVQNLIYHIQGKVAPHVAGIAETMAISYQRCIRSQLRRGSSADPPRVKLIPVTPVVASLQSGQ